MYVRQFEDEEEDSAVSALVEKGEAEYAFEGFDIEFNEKIALTPLTPKPGPVAYGQSISRAFRAEPTTDPLPEMPKAAFDKFNAAQDRLDARNQAQQRIMDLAASSDVARFAWDGRGVAPIGYVKGMALVFARVFCKFKAGDAAAVEMAKKSSGNAMVDALAAFAPEFKAAGMRNDVDGADTLRHVFVLLYGLGMRESAGKFCKGRFAKENTNPETAPAGLFQTSFNARNFSPLLKEMFKNFPRTPPNAGLLNVFKEGVSACTSQDAENVGTGEGKEFQRLSKDSPAFTVEFTALALRKASQHWAPVQDKTIQIRREADAMFKQVQDLVDRENLCLLLRGETP
jgi:hypothetical protein